MTLKTRVNKLSRLFLLLLVMILPLITLAADNSKALFNQGNQEYAKGNFKEALTDWQKVLNSGKESAALYYNMGNAYYRTDDIPNAVLYYEKARKLDPNDEDIAFNIRMANTKVADRVVPVPELFFTRWWRSFILLMPSGTLSVVCVVLILLASVAFAFYLFAGWVWLKKTTFYTGIISLLAGLFFIYVAYSQSQYYASNQQAIVFNSVVNVKSAPNYNSTNLFTIHEGTKVNLMEKNNGWIRVKLANGSQGWIRAADVKAI